jgi:uncharacterized protein YwqG
MDKDQIRALFTPWRTRHPRAAWTPVTSAGAGATLSHFGGLPLLAPAEPWPRCSSCHAPMLFLLQLDLAQCPAPEASSLRQGIVQLFYCSTDAGDCETWRPFSGSQVVRLVKDGTLAAVAPQGVAVLPARAIDRLDQITDTPDPSEHEELGLAYAYDFQAKKVSVRCEELGIALEDVDSDLDVAESISTARSGDKLGGWPHWVQGVEYPRCPHCESRMQLLFQLDSEDNLPVMFGDVGCGHITQCPIHTDVLAYGWACG